MGRGRPEPDRSDPGPAVSIDDLDLDTVNILLAFPGVGDELRARGVSVTQTLAGPRLFVPDRSRERVRDLVAEYRQRDWSLARWGQLMAPDDDREPGEEGGGDEVTRRDPLPVRATTMAV